VWHGVEERQKGVSDVMRDPIFDIRTRRTLLADNVRAVQSMPLATKEHQFIGVLSVRCIIAIREFPSSGKPRSAIVS
jgi:hypothetical protein